MIYTIEKIKQRIEPVARKYGISTIWLFGSYARGEANENSDVDLLIEGGWIRTLFQLASLRLELEEVHKKSVDLITIGNNNEDFLQKIRQEAVILYNAA
ncbi:MAG: nucleotidyltransferase domain-containing protein [Clostridia bacterium]|nr:nucleotidyltransferase domain-containing protein [Clostridia bacterium]